MKTEEIFFKETFSSNWGVFNGIMALDLTVVFKSENGDFFLISLWISSALD